MSQIIKPGSGGGGGGTVTTLDGNTGAATAIAGVINVVGVGSISTSATGNTLTITDSNSATTYDANTGSATPAAGILNVVGTGPITTSATGNTVTITGSGSLATTYDADTGSATPAGGVINFNGTAAQGISSSASGNSVVYTVATATTAQIGVITLATNALAIAGASTTTAITPASLTAKLGTQTPHGLPVGEGTSSALTWTAAPTAGQLLIGTSNVTDPVLNTLTAGTGITITNGSGTITIAASGGTTGVQTLTGNSGGAISPASGNINTVGTGSITIAGGGSTLTTELTGLTNHAVLVGAGTATITNVGPTATIGQVLQSAGAAADPAFSTATYPLTTTINQILFSSAANTITGLATADSASLVTTSAGVPVFSSTMTNGQVIIGSTGATPTAATLTAGSGVNITNGAGSITIAVTGAGMTWSEIATNTAAAASHGYFATAALTLMLPAGASMGTNIGIIAGTTGTVTVAAQGADVIRFANKVSAAAGTAATTAQGDSAQLIYDSTAAVWYAFAGFNGNWTIT